MFLLRRAALRNVCSQPSFRAASQRSFVTRSPIRSFLQASSRGSIPQRRFASDGNTSSTDSQTQEPLAAEQKDQSPAEAESASEVIQDEPSATEQKTELYEESVASSEVADAAGSSEQQSPFDAVKDKATETGRRAVGAASSAAAAATGSSSAAPSLATPQPSKILYVGNLFFELKAEQLEKEFSQYGTIVNTKIATDQNDVSKGFGYIEFESQESAAAAIQGLDQQILEGRRMAVQYHVRRQPRNLDRPSRPNPPSKTLFIGNMSFQMSDKDLNDLFRSVRNVLDVRVAIDRRSGQPRGFAHADFLDVASAEKAKTILSDKSIYGRQLRVDFSRSSAGREARPDPE